MLTFRIKIKTASGIRFENMIEKSSSNCILKALETYGNDKESICVTVVKL